LIKEDAVVYTDFDKSTAIALIILLSTLR